MKNTFQPVITECNTKTRYLMFNLLIFIVCVNKYPEFDATDEHRDRIMFTTVRYYIPFSFYNTCLSIWEEKMLLAVLKV